MMTVFSKPKTKQTQLWFNVSYESDQIKSKKWRNNLDVYYILTHG